MFSCTKDAYLNLSFDLIYRVLNDKTRSKFQKNVARILRLIITNQYKRLKIAFKKYKVDINIYFYPGFFYSRNEVKEFYLYFSNDRTTFFEYGVLAGCNFMTMKTLIDLGVDLLQPNYDFYRDININFNPIDIHWFLETMMLPSFFVIQNKDWKLLNYMVKTNKKCLDLNCIHIIQEAICDPVNPNKLKKYYTKYLNFFVNRNFFLIGDNTSKYRSHWMPKLRDKNDHFTYTWEYYKSIIF